MYVYACLGAYVKVRHCSVCICLQYVCQLVCMSCMYRVLCMYVWLCMGSCMGYVCMDPDGCYACIGMPMYAPMYVPACVPLYGTLRAMHGWYVWAMYLDPLDVHVCPCMYAFAYTGHTLHTSGHSFCHIIHVTTLTYSTCIHGHTYMAYIHTSHILTLHTPHTHIYTHDTHISIITQSGHTCT